MKIAFISDIHSSKPALEKVLEQLENIDEIYCLGDIVGYNPWPEECINLVRDNCRYAVQGNHDRTVRTPYHYSGNIMAYKGLEYAKEKLPNELIQWLSDLPKQRQVTIDGVTFLLVHSHPFNQGEYISPSDFNSLHRQLEENNDTKKYDFVLFGHTHIQHTKAYDNVTLINPGSVGQPRDGDKRAAYAVYDTEEDELKLRRVKYNIREVVERISKVGLPKKTGERLYEAY